MRNDYKSQGFKKWLDKLQQESWQLELLISGFAIFGLFSLLNHILDTYAQNPGDANIYEIGLLASATPILIILIFNLIVHVLLRGLWIGALGLRYVSGDIDYDTLNYSEKFTTYLKRKVGSFDKYISKLEDYSSVMFAVSFLMVFYVLGLIIVIIIIGSLGQFFIELNLVKNSFLDILTKAIFIFLWFLAILVFIDFLTHGFLKKKKWLSKIYFPVYRVFSVLTLSFLYRPLVYNFLDNKFGKRISYFLFPLYFLIIIATGINYKTSNYIKNSNKSTSSFASNNNYYNLLPEKEFVNIAAIKDKIITTNYLDFFITFNEKIENRIYEFNTSLKPENDKRGLSSGITIKNNYSKTNTDSIATEYLKTFKEIYKVSIDSTMHNQDYIISENKRKQIGFETFLNIDSLQQGKHTLHFKRRIKPETDSLVTIISIPFWYYPEK